VSTGRVCNACESAQSTMGLSWRATHMFSGECTLLAERILSTNVSDVWLDRQPDLTGTKWLPSRVTSHSSRSTLDTPPSLWQHRRRLPPAAYKSLSSLTCHCESRTSQKRKHSIDVAFPSGTSQRCFVCVSIHMAEQAQSKASPVARQGGRRLGGSIDGDDGTQPARPRQAQQTAGAPY
jgi:hypothetical protein